MSVPQLGDKKHLVELSERNAKYFRMERFKQMQIVDPDRHTNRLMSQMKVDLRLFEEPRHIECFDNSNLQGSNPVAACVVFRNGNLIKKTTVITTLKPLKDQTILPLWKKSFIDGINAW